MMKLIDYVVNVTFNGINIHGIINTFHRVCLSFIIRGRKILKSLSGVPYLGAFASLSLAVRQEAGEEWQVYAIVQSQQEVICQLEARGILGPQLPNTVQEEQEDWSLEAGR